MNTRQTLTLIAAGLVLSSWAAVSNAMSRPQKYEVYQRAQTPANEEILTRGPVHEAFLAPVVYNPAPTVIVTHQPPEAITEVPPDQAPEAGAVWVPGYWAWDDDSTDFLWVSGCWRVPPSNSAWVPGYWAQSDEGWRWVPGYWLSDNAEDTQYLPTPPDSLDEGPVAAAPDDNCVWVPGYWARGSGSFAWRRGCWIEARPDRVWVPARYVWTPRGCIFIDGYWDYPLEARGVIFAPVHFRAGSYDRDGFVYSPSITINVAVLEGNLFCRPVAGQFYFGDYYAASYVRLGIRPWFDSGNRWYDPVFVHEQWRHRRTDPQWDRNLRDTFEHRRDDRNARPARTWRDLDAQVSRAPSRDRKSLQIAQPLHELSAGKTAPFKFQDLTSSRRSELARSNKAVTDFARERTLREAVRTDAKSAKIDRVQPPRMTTADGKTPRTIREAPPTERRTVTAPTDRRTVTPTPTDRRTVTPAPAPTERTAPRTVTPPTDRPNLVVPSERRDASTPILPRESKTLTDRPAVKGSSSAKDSGPGAVAPPTQRRVYTPPTERRETLTPDASREPVAPTERRTVTPTPAPRRTPTVAPEDRILVPSGPITPPSDRRIVTPPTDRRETRPVLTPRDISAPTEFRPAVPSFVRRETVVPAGPRLTSPVTAPPIVAPPTAGPAFIPAKPQTPAPEIKVAPPSPTIRLAAPPSAAPAHILSRPEPPTPVIVHPAAPIVAPPTAPPSSPKVSDAPKASDTPPPAEKSDRGKDKGHH